MTSETRKENTPTTAESEKSPERATDAPPTPSSPPIEPERRLNGRAIWWPSR